MRPGGDAARPPAFPATPNGPELAPRAARQGRAYSHPLSGLSSAEVAATTRPPRRLIQACASLPAAQRPIWPTSPTTIRAGPADAWDGPLARARAFGIGRSPHLARGREFGRPCRQHPSGRSGARGQSRREAEHSRPPAGRARRCATRRGRSIAAGDGDERWVCWHLRASGTRTVATRPRPRSGATVARVPDTWRPRSGTSRASASGRTTTTRPALRPFRACFDRDEGGIG